MEVLSKVVFALRLASGIVPISLEAVILGPVIQPHMQPRDPRSGRAEPDGLDSHPPGKRVADRPP
jgi:hypothetical protein